VTDSPVWRPSAELNERFYRQVVGPVVDPWPHAAALLGWGSDVLGYDTEQSADHGWGPRLLVIVEENEVSAVREAVEAALPTDVAGWPVRYGWDAVPVQHHVHVTPLRPWLLDTLGLDPRDGLSALDWLVLPQQRLLGVTRGAVYRDQVGELTQVRELLEWYPHDVGLWLLASQWDRVAQEEAFAGRAAQVGDDLGEHLLTGRQVRELMRICFLLERNYWPYSKWFGAAFARLPDGDGLGAALNAAMAAPSRADRQAALATAYELVAKRHNASGLTAGVDPTLRSYYGRPFDVLMAGRLVAACIDAIKDARLRRVAPIGSVDQFVDSTPVLESPEHVARLRAVYEQHLS
jgi:hypothetical protein